MCFPCDVRTAMCGDVERVAVAAPTQWWACVHTRCGRGQGMDMGWGGWRAAHTSAVTAAEEAA